jgi:hypothetical protein
LQYVHSDYFSRLHSPVCRRSAPIAGSWARNNSRWSCRPERAPPTGCARRPLARCLTCSRTDARRQQHEHGEDDEGDAGHVRSGPSWCRRVRGVARCDPPFARGGFARILPLVLGEFAPATSPHFQSACPFPHQQPISETRDRLSADIAAGTGPVVDNEWLAEPLREPLTNQAREDVGWAATGKGRGPCAPAATDRLAPRRSAGRPAARQRPPPDARIVYGGEVSSWTSLTSLDHLVSAGE